MLAADQFDILIKIHKTLEESTETFELKKEEVAAVNELFTKMGLQDYQFDQITKLQTDHHGEQWMGHTAGGKLVPLTQVIDALYRKFEALAGIDL